MPKYQQLRYRLQTNRGVAVAAFVWVKVGHQGSMGCVWRLQISWSSMRCRTCLYINSQCLTGAPTSPPCFSLDTNVEAWSLCRAAATSRLSCLRLAEKVRRPHQTTPSPDRLAHHALPLEAYYLLVHQVSFFTVCSPKPYDLQVLPGSNRCNPFSRAWAA